MNAPAWDVLSEGYALLSSPANRTANSQPRFVIILVCAWLVNAILSMKLLYSKATGEWWQKTVNVQQNSNEK